MRICGLQKLSMVDFPGKLAATVFTGGCNLRCPFCHNALLVTQVEENPRIEVAEILSFLKTRKNLLDGVVLSGGEPLLQKGAADFLEKVKDLGFAVKLDTNGFFPEALEDILSRKLADYVAMDIKNSREKYAMTCGLDHVDLGRVDASLSALKQSGVLYELRTTVVQELHTEGDMEAIGNWLAGTDRYFLQKFVDSGNLIGSGFHSHEKVQMERFADIIKPFIPGVKLRGVD